jgi:hypothetical protein
MSSNPHKALLAAIVALIATPTAFAHQGECLDRLKTPVNAQKWQVQREQIEILEKKGADFKSLTRAYRSLIQNLFATDAGERTRVILLVLPKGSVLRRIDISLPAPQFTEDLIRAMSQQMSDEMVLRKLREFADLEADKLSE